MSDDLEDQIARVAAVLDGLAAPITSIEIARLDLQRTQGPDGEIDGLAASITSIEIARLDLQRTQGPDGEIDGLAASITSAEIARLDLQRTQGPDGEIDGLALPAARQRGRQRSRLAFVAVSAAAVVIGAVALGALVPGRGERAGGPSTTVPLPDDLPPTGVHQSPEDRLVVWLATTALVDECMAAAGFDYLAPTDDELIALSGDWEPHPVLGIRRQGAARRVGYHPAELGGLGTATQAAQLDAMELDQRERYLEALVSYDDGLPPVEIERPDGQPATMSRAQGSGCLLDAEAAFEDTAGHWAVVEEASSDGSEPAAEEVGRDQQVGEALAAWAGCVQAAVGVEASTPDELARRYAFIERVGADGQVAADVTPLADEIEVAVVDARCQTETGLQATWFAADAAAVRARLGADAVHYDDLTRLQIANVATARQILEERGIEPPSLD